MKQFMSMGKSEQLDVTAVNLLWIEEKGIGVPLNDNCKSSFYESAFAQKKEKVDAQIKFDFIEILKINKFVAIFLP